MQGYMCAEFEYKQSANSDLMFVAQPDYLSDSCTNNTRNDI